MTSSARLVRRFFDIGTLLHDVGVDPPSFIASGIVRACGSIPVLRQEKRSSLILFYESHKLRTMRRFLGIATLLVGLVAVACDAPSRAQSEPVEPAEPCTTSGDPALKPAAESWCQAGVFANVNASTATGTFIADLQFSKKGLRSWNGGDKQKILSGFRDLTDYMVRETDMNVAFSLHGTDGQVVGGCTRRRTEAISTCR
jgi:hypothetical protein